MMTPPAEKTAFVPAVPSGSALGGAERLGLVSPRPLTLSTPGSTATAPRTITYPVPQREGTRSYPDGGVGKGTGVVVVLFRGDLRLHDHAALTHALEDAATVVPLYVFDTRQFGQSPAGFQRTGKYRARFLIESVRALRTSLEAIGGGLLVRVGHPEKIVPEVARAVRAKRVFVHKEINADELAVERDLAANLKEGGAELRRFWSNTLYYEDDLPFPISNMPDVYTDFREAVDARAQVREPLQAPEKVSGLPKQVEVGEIPTLARLGIHDMAPNEVANAKAPRGRGVGAIVGGEKEALRRLTEFAEERRYAACEYAGDSGAGTSGGGKADGRATVHTPDFACRISPWLALGCLSPRLIFQEMKRTTGTPGRIKTSYTYYELVWRDFFRCITAKYSAKRMQSEKGSATRTRAAV